MESTCTRVQKGTPAYMPPEANFQNDCSAKWDVWSFGVVNDFYAKFKSIILPY